MFQKNLLNITQETDISGDKNWHNFMTAYTAPENTYGSLLSSGIVDFSTGMILSPTLVFQAQKVSSDAATATLLKPE